MEYAKAYNFSQRENDTSVQLCAKLVGESVEIPVIAALYLISGTATGMWWPAWWGSTVVTGLELRFATLKTYCVRAYTCIYMHAYVLATVTDKYTACKYYN